MHLGKRDEASPDARTNKLRRVAFGAWPPSNPRRPPPGCSNGNLSQRSAPRFRRASHAGGVTSRPPVSSASGLGSGFGASPPRAPPSAPRHLHSFVSHLPTVNGSRAHRHATADDVAAEPPCPPANPRSLRLSLVPSRTHHHHTWPPSSAVPPGPDGDGGMAAQRYPRTAKGTVNPRPHLRFPGPAAVSSTP